MKRDVFDPCQKARQINLDAAAYGTFAELGVGPQVARWFFRAGGASGAIAKMVSSCDSTLGDVMYGPCEHPVRRQRLETMLDHEFKLLIERLTPERGDRTAFFVFADTIATGAEAGTAKAHGWMGIRFQTRPLAPPSQITLHLRLLDREPVGEGFLGVLGVNLVYGARNLSPDPEALLLSLLDHLVTAQVALDFVEFSGPDFSDVDNRLIALKLIEHGLAPGAIIDAAGEVVPPAATDFMKCRKLCDYAGKPRPRRGLKPARGGLIDSLHLAGMPKAA